MQPQQAMPACITPCRTIIDNISSDEARGKAIAMLEMNVERSHEVVPQSSAPPLGAAEQELHVLGCQLLHGDFVLVDCAVDHVRLLLLQHDHARLNRVFNAQARDDTRPLLTDAVATISRLPFGCWVPPSVKCVS